MESQSVAQSILAMINAFNDGWQVTKNKEKFYPLNDDGCRLNIEQFTPHRVFMNDEWLIPLYLFKADNDYNDINFTSNKQVCSYDYLSMGVFDEKANNLPSLLDVMPISLFFRLGDFQRLIFLLKTIWFVNKRLYGEDKETGKHVTDEELKIEILTTNKVVVIDNMYQSSGLSRYIYNSDIKRLNQIVESIFSSDIHLSPIFADDAKEYYLQDLFIDGDLLLPNDVKQIQNSI